MYIEQLYTGCLAEAAYYIESNGEAAVIDPLRETEPYIELAKSRGAKIKYIFETHFHADFVSGHIDLARKTGASIVYGPGATPEYEVYVAKDGETLSLGDITFKVLHTPGHTLESSCFLLNDAEGNPHAVFTGDTLFVNAVGRPDLAVKSDLTKEQLAAMLYKSLHDKIMPLADEVIVYPGHGAGSACGKGIGKETVSTIGEQKKNNYALQPMDVDQFVKEVTDGMMPPPAYFFEDARINKSGYNPIDEVMKQNDIPLTPNDIEAAVQNGALVLDTRDPNDYETGHVPGSMNIGLGGQYAVWVGTLIPIDRELVVVSYPGKESEAVLRLARVGYENVKGVLSGGFAAWQSAGKEVGKVKSIEPEEMVAEMANAVVLDVRNPGETASATVEGAKLIPLGDLQDRLNELNPDSRYLVHCAGGYRSMIAASIMKAAGIQNVYNIYGGFGKIRKSSVPLLETEGVSCSN